jgi:Na+/proline symporter/nitrogen-specific signal transduction histidine kinase
MSVLVVTLSAFAYLILLFLIAYYGDRLTKKGRSIANNPYIYALSMAVYCTAWTFYGSVGRAAQTGVGFLPIYLGPTLFAPLSVFVLRKIILISKSLRITSIADFLASRYGKSPAIGVLVTIIALFAIIPYIALQLKAIALSFQLLVAQNGTNDQSGGFGSAFYATVTLTVFTILFGTRNIDPNERHEGLVSAIAFESLVKLITFLCVGVFVTYFMYDGFGDIIEKSVANPLTNKILSPELSPLNPISWFWLTLVSFFAIICLPRQFHVSIVENTNPRFVNKAMWVFPLYLLIINIFVLPIALAGLLQFEGMDIAADTYVLELPLLRGNWMLALLVFIGGISAATSMVIVETMAISIMMSNHLLMPFYLRRAIRREGDERNYNLLLLNLRRFSMVVLMALAYLYLITIGTDYTLVSIGLISFVAVAQFAPSIIGGLYWKRATKKGAFTGLLAGFIIWFFTLPVPTLVEADLFTKTLTTNGLFGLDFLKPSALFGLNGMDQISHAAFWSLFINVSLYISVSLNTNPSKLELAQGDYFVDIHKYLDAEIEIDIFRRTARVSDLIYLLYKFLGEDRAQNILQNFENEYDTQLKNIKVANAELVNYVETHLAGALGSASAKIIISSVAKEQQVSFEEIVTILTQTQEIVKYSKALEQKSFELEQTTLQLKTANEQLQELDKLKADFITTVTHELRTPITSIKSLSSIIRDYNDIADDKKEEYLGIIINECNRISRLINQVLDIEKLPTIQEQNSKEAVNLVEVMAQSIQNFKHEFIAKDIDFQWIKQNDSLMVFASRDKLVQVFVNLISNAIKFCNPEEGRIIVTISKQNNQVVVKINDNGMGIEKEKLSFIFERFTQLNNEKLGKPAGSGLGLFITKKIVELYKGEIVAESEKGKGATFVVKLDLYEEAKN